MGEAYGLDEQAAIGYGPVVDARVWGHLPRRRVLLASVPPDPHPWAPPLRPAPWRQHWRPHWQGEMQPLMRAHWHEGDFIMGRPYQYAARALLYQDGSGWEHRLITGVIRGIAALMPEELRPGWTLLNSGRTRGRDEQPAARAAEWVARHGEGHGFRAPDMDERSRATGCGAYLEGLQLNAVALYNAQGNHFDRAIVGWRLSRVLLAWAQGGDLPRGPRPLGAADLERLYQRVRIAVEAGGMPAEPVGVPVDVQAAAATQWGGPTGAHGDTSTAAEDGRADS